MLQQDNKKWHLAIGFMLVLFPLVAYWQVAFMKFPLKWDAIDYFQQRYFFICECIEAKTIPFWNPYEYLGSPFHADPQSGFWYPVVWLVGWLMPCDGRLVSAIFILHIIIGGFGMRRLLRTLGMEHWVAVCFALAFQCSGFFVANSQHTSYVIAAAWIPLVLSGIFRLLDQPNWKAALTTGFCAAMLVTGGYPAVVIILAYCVLPLGIYKVIICLRQKDYTTLAGIAGYTALGALVAVFLSLGYLVSMVEVFPAITRHEALSTSQINFGHYYSPGWISQILPYAASILGSNTGTDVSMINGYTGLLSFMLFVPGLIWGQLRYKWFFVVLAIVAFLASLGPETPVRLWLAQWLPGMDKFRFPGVFRVFWMLSWLVIAASGLQAMATHKDRVKNRALLAIVLAFFVLLLVIALLALVGGGKLSYPPLFFMKAFAEYYKGLTYESMVLSQAWISGVLLLLLIGIFHKAQRYFKPALIGWVALELLIATQLNVPATVVVDRKMSSYLKAHAGLPSGFPMPNQADLLPHFPDGIDLNPNYLGANMVLKLIGPYGYNPFQLKTYDGLSKNEDCKQAIVQGPVARVLGDSLATIAWETWQPGHMQLTATASKPATLVVAQMYLPGWELYINNNDYPIQQYCDAVMQAELQSGASHITLVYDKPVLKILLYLTFGGALVVVTLLLAVGLKRLKPR